MFHTWSDRSGLGTRFAILLVVVTCLLGGNATLAAEAPGAERATRFLYKRDATAAGCPDESVLRAEIANRVEFDPFDEGAARLLVCRVSGDRRGLRARIELTTDSRQPPAVRELVSREVDCRELSEALVVALSIAINPLVGQARPAVPPVIASPPPPPSVSSVVAPAGPQVVTAQPSWGAPPSSPPAVPTEPASPPPVPGEPVVLDPPPAAPPPAKSPAPAPGRASVLPAAQVIGPRAASTSRLVLRLGGEGVAAAGLDPGLGYGGGVFASVGGRRYSGEVALRAVAPSSLALERGSMRVWQWNLLVAPCAHLRFVSACLLGSAGIVYGSGEGLIINRRAQSTQVAAGARAVAEYPLAGAKTGSHLRLRATLDVTTPLTRTHFWVGDAEAWVSPRVAAVLGLGLVGVFF